MTYKLFASVDPFHCSDPVTLLDGCSCASSIRAIFLKFSQTEALHQADENTKTNFNNQLNNAQAKTQQESNDYDKGNSNGEKEKDPQ